MAETRFERELRDLLTIELEGVHGPHPRWADAPVARRVGRVDAPPSRRSAFGAVAVLAAAILVTLVLTVVVLPNAQPVATQPATVAPTLQPLPSSVSPSAFPTVGEVALGSVAIATQNSAPAMAVRVMTQPSRPGEAVLRIDIRVVGPITTAVNAGSFGVVHDNQRDALPMPGGPDPLAIPPGTALGTTVSAEFTIPVSANEWADLAYYGTDTPAFTYPIHRPAAAIPADGTCPGLAEWAAASAQPEDTPRPRVSFPPDAIPTQPTTGTIPLGTVGALASTDGQVGALVRVSNVRFCDRFPDARPDELLSNPQRAQYVLADVDVQVLRDGTLDGWLETNVVKAVYKGYYQLEGPRPPAWFPGADTRTSLAAGPGFTFHGAMAWAVPGTDGQLTIGLYGIGTSEERAPQFAYAVRSGIVGANQPVTPPPAEPIPTLTPISAPLAADAIAVIKQGNATTEVRIGRVQQVSRYTGVAPKVGGNVFLEFAYQSIAQSDTYTWNPSDWVVVKPDGTAADELWQTLSSPDDPSMGYVPMPGGPEFIGTMTSETFLLNAPYYGFPFFQIAEVPATGRITLEYRPNGGPAVATWVLREQ